MSFLRTLSTALYSIFVDALFPLSKQEREIFSISPEEVWRTLDRAPQTPIADSMAIFAYKDLRTSKLVWNIKYKKHKYAIQIGGFALHKFISEKFNGQLMLIPIPITERRRKERGYNQCELLVDEIDRLNSNLKNILDLKIEKNLLIRGQHLSRQTLKNRQDRLKSAKGIFSINEKLSHNFPKDRQIIVVDDVITTGSTINEAIETLRLAGFSNVHGLSLAH